MTTTDTFTSQAATELERSKWLLRLLTYKFESGTTTDDRCIRCVYCDWRDEDYKAEPEHTADCPIEKVREFLWAEDSPYPLEGRRVPPIEGRE